MAAKVTNARLISVELGRKKGDAWAHVSWGDDDELVIPISTEHLPAIEWSDALLKEVEAAAHAEGSIIASAKVK